MKPEAVKLEDASGDFLKSSVSVTPAEFVHTVTEIVINHDGDGDDSGFQSHCVEKTFDPKVPVNGQLRLESDDGTPSSIGSSEKSVVSSGAQRRASDITSPSRPVAFTPAQIKRRSLLNIRRNNNSFPLPTLTTADRPRPKSPSMPMSTSVSREHTSNSCWRVRGGNNLVAQTVAERRARAEALEAERRRKCRANLEASEAALEAARRRAHSLRAARSLELRNREEERHAKVAARRKLLEEERKEYLSRRVISTSTIPETGAQSHHLRSLRHPNPRTSICGFASELDPSDPRYCPFGFGSSTRRDVCPSPMQQLGVIRKTDSCSGRGGFRHATISKLSTSFAVESQGRLTTSANAAFTSIPARPNKPSKDKNTNSTPSNRRQSRNATLKDCTNPSRSSNCSLRAQYAPKQLQPTSPGISKSRSKIPPIPTPRLKALTLQPSKTAVSASFSSVPQTAGKIRCGAAVKSSILAHTGCEPTEAVAPVHRARLYDNQDCSQRKRVEEDEEAARLKREKEKNSLLEAMAQATVSEAINLAVAELKAEAVEAFATSSNKGTVEKAAGLLSGLADSHATSTERRRSRRRCLPDCSTVSPEVDGTRLLRNALTSSKEVLNDALERMTSSVNADSMRKRQSEVISALANAASNAAEREKRRVRVDQIMSRVRSSTGTPLPVRVAAKVPLRIAVEENNSLGYGELKDSEPRHYPRPNGAIRSMLASGLLSSNSKAALLLRNHLVRNEQAPPPLELCSPCAETSSISDVESHSTNEHNTHCHGFEANLDTQLARQSPCSPVNSDKEQCLHEIGDWHSSSTSTTIAAHYPSNRQAQSGQLASTHHSSCSDVSTTSGLQH